MKTLKFSVILIALSFISFTIYSQGDPKLTEFWEPVPATVTPGTGTSAPSDAIVLYDGSSLDQWQNKDGGKVEWVNKDGVLTVKPGTGAISTKTLFADCQLHIEWRTPSTVVGESQGRGNSGIFFQERYELQVLDNYENRTYSNGQAGSIYKQNMPLINCCRKPGEWQTYDVIFTAPRFNEDGSLKSPAYITVLQNNILVQNNFELKGSTAYIGLPSYKKHDLKGALALQEHGNDVSYRNIWIREL